MIRKQQILAIYNLLFAIAFSYLNIASANAQVNNLDSKAEQNDTTNMSESRHKTCTALYELNHLNDTARFEVIVDRVIDVNYNTPLSIKEMIDTPGVSTRDRSDNPYLSPR